MSNNLPDARTIRLTKEAFAAAPSDAGAIPNPADPDGQPVISGIENPDGLPGINLWIDTGGVFDPAAIEDGAGLCDDGIDNGADGLTDFRDPDCIAGDNLGGGQVLVDETIFQA